MTSSWVSPDLRPAADGTPLSVAPPRTAPLWWQDLWAGALTVAVTVLVGAPVGLLWAALAPAVPVQVEGDEVRAVDTHSDSFIAVDGYFLGAVVVAGVVGALLTWWWASAHGPVVVLALAAGGLAAAWVAMVVGSLPGSTPAELVAQGVQGRAELGVRLRATTALLGWPIAALLTCMVLSLRRRVSSG